MTVRDLKEQLKDIPEDVDVYKLCTDGKEWGYEFIDYLWVTTSDKNTLENTPALCEWCVIDYITDKDKITGVLVV